MALAGTTGFPFCTSSFLTVFMGMFSWWPQWSERAGIPVMQKASQNTHMVFKLCLHHIFWYIPLAKASYMPKPSIGEGVTTKLGQKG